MTDRTYDAVWPYSQDPPDNLITVTEPAAGDRIPDLISIGEVCTILGRSRTAIIRLTEQGVIYGVKVNPQGVWVYPENYIRRIADVLGPRQRPGIRSD